MKGWWKLAAAVAAVAVIRELNKRLEWDKDNALQFFGKMSDRLGIWAMPAYVGMHTLTLALCLPYAIFFEAGASLLFGFFPAVLCVFAAKISGASLSFLIGRFQPVIPEFHMNSRRLVFRSSNSAVEWAKRNKHFNILSQGVERDGWKFVLLVRFSPIPSYVINYALAATKVAFLKDFLLPTVIGCVPMILQNTSLGTLAGAAVSSSSKSHISSFVFPLIGIGSSVLISMRIKRYSADVKFVELSSDDENH